MDRFRSGGDDKPPNEKWMNGKSFGLACVVPGVLAVNLHINFSVFLEIFLRQGMLLVLALPENRDNPPALAVIHQLNAVDAALKWLCIFGRVA